VAYARALDGAFRDRFEAMGDTGSEAPGAPGCTTHFSVVDREGNLCAVTQTLLSIFGSRVVSPATGILLNNGIMWFDPEPGKPNSLAPGKRCLGNYCPVVGETGDGRRFALGASGGRKIIGTVLQIASFLIDHRFTLEEAFHQPRIDMSGGERVIADRALPADTLRALEAAYPTSTARRTVYPYPFAVPAAVLREGDMNMGCTEIMSPWGDAVAEGTGTAARA
jgi:gamma-glutamyltranspeptidase/glutathione hydrolase